MLAACKRNFTTTHARKINSLLACLQMLAKTIWYHCYEWSTLSLYRNVNSGVMNYHPTHVYVVFPNPNLIDKILISLLTWSLFSLVPSLPPRAVGAQLDCQKYQLVVSWNAIDKEYVNGLLLGYQVSLTSYSYKSSLKRNFTVDGKDVETRIPVDECVSHDVKVAAFTKPGMGPYSTIVRAQTHCPCGKFYEI